MAEQFILGLATGVGATILIAIAVRVWPWVINALSKEARVEGEWKWYDSSSMEPVGNMSIRQFGSNIAGSFERTKAIEGISTNRKFKFRGKLYGQVLVIFYQEPEDPKNVRGSIILRLVSSRNIFYGKTMYFEHYKNEISTYKFVASKQDALHPIAAEYLEFNVSEKNEVEKDAA